MEKRLNLANLVLIGGGIMRNNETAHIDKWLIDWAKKIKKEPKVLFIPTASNDLLEYIDDFTSRYEAQGATVVSLKFVNEKYLRSDVINEFNSAQLIYFGGGNVDILLDAIKKYRLKQVILESSKNSIIVGQSAGALIWFDEFVNFNRVGNKFVNFKIGKGMKLVDGKICTHFTKEMMDNKVVRPSKEKPMLFAIGNKVAITWRNKDVVALKKAINDFAYTYEYNFINSKIDRYPISLLQN